MVLAEFLVQLATKRDPRNLAILRSIWEQAERGRRRCTLKELTIAFTKTVTHYRKVFAVVDALDECDPIVIRRFLHALDPVQNTNLSLLIFSRPYLQLDKHFSKDSLALSVIEVQAAPSDLDLFVNDRVADISDLRDVIDDSDITLKQISDDVVEKAGFR